MASLQQRLRDPKLIKLAALATAILAISIGLGVSLGGRGKDSVASSSTANDEDALGKYASGKVGEIVEPMSEATNYARYYGNGYADYTSVTTTIRGSSGIDNSGDWDDDGWSSEGGTKSSTTKSKCDKGGSYAGAQDVSSSAKAEKTGGRTRRLGGGNSWESSVWSPSGDVKSGSTTSSVGKSEKTVKTTSNGSARSKSEKSAEVSEGVTWYEDEDCGTTTEVVVASKASKTKSSKMVKESSAKSTPATVSSAWERSPPATVASVWGTSPEIPETPEPIETSSPVPTLAPSSPELESLAPVQQTFNPTLSPIDETSTAAPTPCTGRVWYFNEEKEKCINDGENDGEDEYENMRTCCETEVGMNVECPYEDVCFTPTPTPMPTTAKPIGPEQLPTTATPSISPSAAPTSDAPTMTEIITESPTTSAPITSEPTSAAPTTDAPTVPEIITGSPTTTAPITSEPTSAAPSSDSPTMPEIITEEPTTAAPITSNPTSAAPTTDAPTVSELVTANPTTTLPTSAKPTTSKPTHSKPKPTVKPTTPEIISAEPTMDVTAVEQTVAPTPCDACDGGRKWYYDGEKCTNNGEYESDEVLFENMQTCCKESFGVNIKCPYEDVCIKGSPTKSPTKDNESTPIPTLAPSPSPTPCEGRKWYIVNISQETFQCTNGYDIPASAVDDFTFFDSLAECCDDMFGDGVECEYSDVCSNETPQPSSMELTTSPTKKVTTAKPTSAEIITAAPTAPEVITLVPTKDTTAEPTSAEIITAEPTSTELVTLVPTKMMTGEPTTAEITTTEPTSPELLTLAPTKMVTAAPTPFEIITAEPSSPEVITLVPTKATTAVPTSAEIITAEPTLPELVTLAPTKTVTGEPTTAELFTVEPTSPEIVTLVPTTAELNTLEPSPTPPSTILTLAPTTCKERVWHLYGGICTNMIESTSNDTDNSSYTTLVDCCQNEMPGKKCAFEDYCYSSQAPSPGSSALESMMPTTQPSFGSTPTVSKETTGPPTVLVPDRTRGYGMN